MYTHTHTHTHTFDGPFSETTRVSRYQKGKTNLDFSESTDSEWQWHQLSHRPMQICTSLQTDNHASTLPLSFLQAGCPSCRPTNQPSVAINVLQCKQYLTVSLLSTLQRNFLRRETDFVNCSYIYLLNVGLCLCECVRMV